MFDRSRYIIARVNCSTAFNRVSDHLSLHDQLKKQEKQFRQHCNDEIYRLTSVINSLRTQGKQGTDTFCVDIQKISEQRQYDHQRYIKVKNILAKKTREISTLQRRIDDIPSRAELAQYQRRFVELHKLVSATLTETRQYFTLYNTLNDTQIFLDKELQLLNILYEKFDTAMTSQSNKNIYIKHLVQFLDETQSNLEKLEIKKNTKKDMKDILNDNYVLLLDQQRQYSKLVRDFGTQIRRNEDLHTVLT
ncbi:Coiled-coil domain-containing protein 93-like isoform X3 [Oopsacas minuta]|uniref:Coiled-coil domain-containing protein 93 n=1 Tax=Oopsacas minuta TaxID=111878 RepID=A0AAV7JUH3_9METZ|nr:Coiled-coil domain-containing protein 93-like isoform X3 [Oopsacas minuta]